MGEVRVLTCMFVQDKAIRTKLDDWLKQVFPWQPMLWVFDNKSDTYIKSDLLSKEFVSFFHAFDFSWNTN